MGKVSKVPVVSPIKTLMNRWHLEFMGNATAKDRQARSERIERQIRYGMYGELRTLAHKGIIARGG